MADQKYFPTIPSSHWQNLRIQFKKSIPNSITTNYLASILNMTESSAGANILPGLRNIGLVDADNKTNQEMAKKFRDDSAYPGLCREIITKCYPQELIDAFPDENSDKEKVKMWFMNHTGSGDSAATKLTSFFLILLEANPTITSKPNNPTKKDGKVTFGKRKEKVDGPAVPNTAQRKADTTVELDDKNTGKKNPDLNINIQIHISSDASPEQIKSIFENMSKYLYKN